MAPAVAGLRYWYKALSTSFCKPQTSSETTLLNITNNKRRGLSILPVHNQIISSSSCCLSVWTTNANCKFILVKVHLTLQQGMSDHLSLQWQIAACTLASSGQHGFTDPTLRLTVPLIALSGEVNTVSSSAFFYIPAFYLRVIPCRGIVKVHTNPISWETVSLCRWK